MKLLLLSDIHGNWPALAAVLQARVEGHSGTGNRGGGRWRRHLWKPALKMAA